MTFLNQKQSKLKRFFKNSNFGSGGLPPATIDVKAKPAEAKVGDGEKPIGWRAKVTGWLGSMQDSVKKRFTKGHEQTAVTNAMPKASSGKVDKIKEILLDPTRAARFLSYLKNKVDSLTQKRIRDAKEQADQKEELNNIRNIGEGFAEIFSKELAETILKKLPKILDIKVRGAKSLCISDSLNTICKNNNVSLTESQALHIQNEIISAIDTFRENPNGKSTTSLISEAALNAINYIRSAREVSQQDEIEIKPISQNLGVAGYDNKSQQALLMMHENYDHTKEDIGDIADAKALQIAKSISLNIVRIEDLSKLSPEQIKKFIIDEINLAMTVVNITLTTNQTQQIFENISKVIHTHSPEASHSLQLMIQVGILKAIDDIKSSQKNTGKKDGGVSADLEELTFEDPDEEVESALGGAGQDTLPQSEATENHEGREMGPISEIPSMRITGWQERQVGSVTLNEPILESGELLVHYLQNGQPTFQSIATLLNIRELLKQTDAQSQKIANGLIKAYNGFHPDATIDKTELSISGALQKINSDIVEPIVVDLINVQNLGSTYTALFTENPDQAAFDAVMTRILSGIEVKYPSLNRPDPQNPAHAEGYILLSNEVKAIWGNVITQKCVTAQNTVQLGISIREFARVLESNPNTQPQN